MKEIPGPKGNLFLGVAPELAAGAPRFLSRVADEYGEIARFRMFHETYYLVASPDLVREVLVAQAANFPKSERDVTILSRMIGRGLVTTNGEEHHRQRALTQPAFHHKRIEAYADTVVDYTEAYLDRYHDGGWRDVAGDMMALTMYIVSKTLFGAGMGEMVDETERVSAAIDHLQNIADSEFQEPFVIPEWLPTRRNRKRRESRATVDEVINRLVAERRAAADRSGGRITDTGDLLSMLLLARDEAGESMTDREVRDQLLTLFTAGHETTSNALTWTWYLLSQHPAVEARLHEEIDRVLGGRAPRLADLPALPYTLQVIKEAMRLYPPAWVLNMRVAAGETMLGEYRVPKGAYVWVSPFAMHRRPAYFPEPERFDPDRWTPEREKALPRYAYMPFGGGPRVCIGNSFAMMEAHLIVADMARRVSLRLDPAQAIDLAARVTLSNRTGMRMRVEERVHEQVAAPAQTA